MLEALKALQHEGTKSEVAQGFKDSGNEMVAAKKWKDAKEFYNKGIAVLADRTEDKWDKAEDMTAEEEQRVTLEEQLFVNRALCNLELSASSPVHFNNIAYIVQKTTDLRRSTVRQLYVSIQQT